MIALVFFQAKRRDREAFWASSAYIKGMLGGAAFALYPVLLPSSSNPTYSLTVYSARTGEYSMRVGLIWWVIGMFVATGYFVFAYRFFRGKVMLEADDGH